MDEREKKLMAEMKAVMKADVRVALSEKPDTTPSELSEILLRSADTLMRPPHR